MICQNDPSDKAKCLYDIFPQDDQNISKAIIWSLDQMMGPDEGFGDVWNIHANVVHDGGLEM